MNSASEILDNDKIEIIKKLIKSEVQEVSINNAEELDKHLKERKAGVTSTIDGIISIDEVDDIDIKLNELLRKLDCARLDGSASNEEIVNYRHGRRSID